MLDKDVLNYSEEKVYYSLGTFILFYCSFCFMSRPAERQTDNELQCLPNVGLHLW